LEPVALAPAGCWIVRRGIWRRGWCRCRRGRIRHAAVGGGAPAGRVGGGPPAGAVGGGAPSSNNAEGNGAAGTGDPSRNAGGTTPAVPADNPALDWRTPRQQALSSGGRPAFRRQPAPPTRPSEIVLVVEDEPAVRQFAVDALHGTRLPRSRSRRGGRRAANIGEHRRHVAAVKFGLYWTRPDEKTD
jgi:hypothetical protein